MDVVSADVPALHGLDVLDKESLIVETVTNRLTKRMLLSGPKNEDDMPLADVVVDKWWVLSLRYAGHINNSISLTSPTFFARNQLHKLHRQFVHTSSEKLYNQLKRSGPE